MPTRRILDGQLRARDERVAKIDEADRVAGFDALIVRSIDETEGQDAKIDQILRVNAREAFRQHHAQAQEARTQRRMFAARSLAIVAPAYHGMALRLPRTFGIARVDHVEGKLGNLGNVAAKRREIDFVVFVVVGATVGTGSTQSSSLFHSRKKRRTS